MDIQLWNYMRPLENLVGSLESTSFERATIEIWVFLNEFELSADDVENTRGCEFKSHWFELYPFVIIVII